MKKLFILASAAIFVVGCAMNEVTDTFVGGSSDDAIRFSSLNEKSTRAANDIADNYRVVMRSSDTSAEDWFLDAVVGSDAGSGVDDILDYLGSKKWPSGLSLDAFAYSPADALSSPEPAFSATGDIVYNYTVPGDVDFTVAAQQQDLTSENPTVNLQFKHMLSRIDVRLLADDSFLQACLEQMQELYPDANYTDSDKPSKFAQDFRTTIIVPYNSGSVKMNSDSPSFTTDISSAGRTYYLAEGGEDESPESTTAQTFYIAPQDAIGAVVRVENFKLDRMEWYDSENKNSDGSLNLADYEITSGDVVGDQFLQGYRYNMTLNLSATSNNVGGEELLGINIKFGSDVDEWDDVEGPDLENNNPLPDYKVGDVSQTSNSYIVNPPSVGSTTYYIPLNERINTFWTDYSGLSTYEDYLIGNSDGLEVVVMWYDASSLTTIKNGTAPSTTFTTVATGISNVSILSGSSFGVTSTPKDLLDTYGSNITNFCVKGSTNVALQFDIASNTAHGNVLVAIRKTDQETSEQTILWSWHLWVTNYDPYSMSSSDKTAIAASAAGNSYANYSVTGGNVHRYKGTYWTTGGKYVASYIMDRNLGATGTAYANQSAGTGALHYQYGRKDPFPYTLGDPCTVVAGTKKIYESVTAPSTFITGSNWSSENTATTYLWNDPFVSTSSNGKSFFDPSPLGWKLPENGTWSDFSSSTFTVSGTGRVYNTNTWYPSSGSRLYSSGSFNNVGSNGYYWSASPNSTSNGYNLNFNSSAVNPSNNNNRANGFAVRPLREFAITPFTLAL